MGSAAWTMMGSMPLRRPARPRAPAALARARFPPPVLEILRVLDDAGHRSWIVGGAVRDALLGRARSSSDLDVATPAHPQQVLQLFPKVVPTGIEHGTVTVVAGGMAVEVTTFRGEGAYLDARRPSSVHFLDDVDEDLSRRDFTVNALAWDPLHREFRDPFGGRDDVRARLLRAVGDPAARFAEDGLRPLRAVRFAAQLGFRLDRATAAAIGPALPSTARVAAERKTEELARLLVAPDVRRGLDLLRRTRLLAVVLGRLADLPRRRLLHAFDVAERIDAELPLRIAALLHVMVGAGPRSRAGTDVQGVLDELRLSRQVRDSAAALALEHGCILDAGRAAGPRSAAELRRWLSRVGPSRARQVVALRAADARSLAPGERARRERSAVRTFRSRLARVERSRPPLAPRDLAIDGRGRAVMEVLGVGGGPVVGEAMRHLLDRVLDDPRLNNPSALTSELERWSAGAPRARNGPA
jgi:tRNA nucleotidyltransferase (CCA-adding enzyme)